MILLLAIIIGYGAGCLNGSQLVGRWKKVDIKNSGVKNAGASNTTIVLGWKYGVIVGLIDILKAVVPILLVPSVLAKLGLGQDVETLFIFLMGSFIILGHNYPVNMNFNGGKGTASFIGMMFAVDWKIGLLSFGILLFFTLLTDYLVIGVLLMYITFTAGVWVDGYGLQAVLISAALTAISSVKHLENYRRIKDKTETTISGLFKKDKSNQSLHR